MKVLHRTNKTKKGYTLLELIISLAIIAIATTIMINFLVVSVEITVKTLARSFVRSEISNATLLVARDIRNSDQVVSIDCPINGPGCEIVLSLSGERYRWRKCPDGASFRICKEVWSNSTSSYTQVFRSSASVNIDYMDISYGYSLVNNTNEINILVTLSASHEKPGLSITNIVRQSSASTRNYSL